MRIFHVKDICCNVIICVSSIGLCSGGSESEHNSTNILLVFLSADEKYIFRASVTLTLFSHFHYFIFLMFRGWGIMQKKVSVLVDAIWGSHGGEDVDASLQSCLVCFFVCLTTPSLVQTSDRHGDLEVPVYFLSAKQGYKATAVPLHAMKELGGRGDVAPTHLDLGTRFGVSGQGHTLAAL
jgi:hypothetical protein